MKLSFKQYVNIISEGATEDVQKIQTQISDINVKLQQMSKPLQDQLRRLQQILAVKQKQAAAEQARSAPAGTTSQQTPAQLAGSGGQA